MVRVSFDAFLTVVEVTACNYISFYFLNVYHTGANKCLFDVFNTSIDGENRKGILLLNDSKYFNYFKILQCPKSIFTLRSVFHLEDLVIIC